MSPHVTSQADRAELPAGARFGRYAVVRRLATGGMAEVYLGRAEGIHGFRRAVALKLVLPHLAGDEQFVNLFVHEAKIAAHLGHPNIIQIFELGRERGDVFIAMEYVHGHTLRHVLARARGPLPLDCALFVVLSTCNALHHAHTAVGNDGRPLRIVHRDVSPSNVMVRPDGQIKVVDFGIAKAMTGSAMTQTGTVKGKTGYMSPEQCRGEPLDQRSDIFNLGIMLYETTTGRRAFGGSNLFEAMNRINEGRYRPPAEIVEGYPPELATIVSQALAHDPAERPANALVLRERLEAFAQDHGLAPSELALAAWLRQHVGAPPPLDLEIDLPSATSGLRGGLRRWGLALAGVISTAAVVVAASSFASGDDSSAPTASAPESPAPPREPTSPDVEAEDTNETVATSPVAPPLPREPTSTPARKDPPARRRTKPTRPRRSSSSSSKKGRSGGRPKASTKGKRDPLFPWMNEG
ncbi:MAG: protein kinase [Myxococcota bacterium]